MRGLSFTAAHITSHISDLGDTIFPFLWGMQSLDNLHLFFNNLFSECEEQTVITLSVSDLPSKPKHCLTFQSVCPAQVSLGQRRTMLNNGTSPAGLCCQGIWLPIGAFLSLLESKYPWCQFSRWDILSTSLDSLPPATSWTFTKLEDGIPRRKLRMIGAENKRKYSNRDLGTRSSWLLGTYCPALPGT